jgi:hypothetical protein
MNNKLLNFMVALGQDQKVQRAYEANADATMRAHGLSDREIDAVRGGDESAVYRAVGATEDHTVAKLVFAPIASPMKKAA